MIRRLVVRFLDLDRWIHLLLVAGYMALIFWLSTLSQEEVPIDFLGELIVNFCHVVVYGVLAVLLLALAASFRRRGPGERRFAAPAMLAVLAVILLYGISDEIHQAYTGRDPAVLDIVSDLVGGLLGILILSFIVDRRPRGLPFAVLSLLLVGGGLVSSWVQSV